MIVFHSVTVNQWMDEECQELHKWWNNVEHYPGLVNFPYHAHTGDEKNRTW
jgi:nitrate reductase beta subunit